MKKLPLIYKGYCGNCKKVRIFRQVIIMYYKQGYECTKCHIWHTV